MAESANRPKRNHHILPKKYLGGFVINGQHPFTWVYKKGEEYSPGTGKNTNNPCKQSIRQIFARDFYADPTGGRKINKESFEIFENQLEKLEKPCDLIFQKLRAFQGITAQERHQFAVYIEMMRRRVVAGRELVVKLLPKNAETYEPSVEVYRKLGWPDIPETRAILRGFAEKMIGREGYAETMHSKVSASVANSLIVQTLAMMTWSYIVTSDAHPFITSDNPVFTCEKIGLRLNVSELSFPVSAQVALVASWNKSARDGFTNASQQIVREINRRTASKATRFVYASIDRDWIVKMQNNTTYEYRPIFSARATYPVVKITREKNQSEPRIQKLC